MRASPEGKTSTGRAAEISKSYEQSRLYADTILVSICRQTSVGLAFLHNVKSPSDLGPTTLMIKVKWNCDMPRFGYDFNPKLIPRYVKGALLPNPLDGLSLNSILRRGHINNRAGGIWAIALDRPVREMQSQPNRQEPLPYNGAHPVSVVRVYSPLSILDIHRSLIRG